MATEYDYVSSEGSIFPPGEVDVLGVLVERMGEAFQRHVEGSVPGNDLGGGTSDHVTDFSEFGLGALSEVGGLVELPDLGLRDLVIGSGDDGVVHVGVGLVVADVLVGVLVLDDVGSRGEDVEGALSFVVHGEGDEHDGGAGVEVADGELGGGKSTSRSSR